MKLIFVSFADQIFGSHLHTLCERENSTVPRFVKQCIEAVEKRVTVNHAGSVVTKEPIDLGDKGYISFSDKTLPHFTGESMSLFEFREYAPEQEQSEDIGMEMSQ